MSNAEEAEKKAEAILTSAFARWVEEMLTPDELEALDAWITRQCEPDLTRFEAMRRLVRKALGTA